MKFKANILFLLPSPATIPIEPGPASGQLGRTGRPQRPAAAPVGALAFGPAAAVPGPAQCGRSAVRSGGATGRPAAATVRHQPGPGPVAVHGRPHHGRRPAVLRRGAGPVGRLSRQPDPPAAPVTAPEATDAVAAGRRKSALPGGCSEGTIYTN